MKNLFRFWNLTMCLMVAICFYSCNEDDNLLNADDSSGSLAVDTIHVIAGWGNDGVTFYEDEQYCYQIAMLDNTNRGVRILSYYKVNDSWTPAYEKIDLPYNMYDKIEPIAINGEWISGISPVLSYKTYKSLDDISMKLTDYNTKPSCESTGFLWDGHGFYVYITTANGNREHYRFYATNWVFNREQGSSQFGLNRYADISYQLY